MPTYKVSISIDANATPARRMVKAKSPAQVRQFISRNMMKIEIADAEDAIEMTKAGIDLEDATGEPTPDPSSPE